MAKAKAQAPQSKFPLLSRSEAARLLGVTSCTLATWEGKRKKGLPGVYLRCTKIGKSMFYTHEDINAFIAEVGNTHCEK